MIDFLSGLKTSVEGVTKEVEGMTYIPWAVALGLAARPKVDVVQFNPETGDTVQRFFGGAVVAVENNGQRVYLPILDAKNQPVSADKVTSRDVNDARNRCRAKSIAITNGVGMCLYANYGTNHRAFLRDMGVAPDTDLSQIEPLTMKKNNRADYVDWATALTAMRITDQEATFRVLEFNVVDRSTGEIERLPFSADPFGTYEVAVEVSYKGQSHTEWLPIMGVAEVNTRNGKKKMDHQPLRNPTVFNWNTAVMRCLAKAIAVSSGYGLSVYAKESVVNLTPDEQLQSQGQNQDHGNNGHQQGSHESSNQGNPSTMHEPSYDDRPSEAPRNTGRLQSRSSTRTAPPSRAPQAVSGRTGGRTF